MDVKPNYDYIIVGGGISGFYAALSLQKKHPSDSIAILEKYKGVGGRTYSYQPPDFPGVGWEMGAARIHESHKMVIDLVKKYGLTLLPISSEVVYKKTGSSPIIPNTFETFSIPAFITPLTQLSDVELREHTLYSLMVKVYGSQKTKEIFDEFPYYGEVYLLRADLALKTFVDGEMGTRDKYFVIKEGFSALIHAMRDEFEGGGGTVLVRHSLLEVKKGMGGQGDGVSTDCVVEFGRKKKDEPHGFITLRAEKACILALHADALRTIKGVSHMKELKHVKTLPLFRIYAIFPKPVWFKNIPRLVTQGGVRYIIPIDVEKGVTMISYTDGEDSEKYNAVFKKEGEKGLMKVVMKDVRELFPDLKIPDPVFFKGHHWDTGVTYWLKGDYNVEDASLAACKPFPKSLPGVYVCGESFSLRQAWVEGALEHTATCLKVVESS